MLLEQQLIKIAIFNELMTDLEGYFNRIKHISLYPIITYLHQNCPFMFTCYRHVGIKWLMGVIYLPFSCAFFYFLFWIHETEKTWYETIFLVGKWPNEYTRQFLWKWSRGVKYSYLYIRICSPPEKPRCPSQQLGKLEASVKWTKSVHCVSDNICLSLHMRRSGGFVQLTCTTPAPYYFNKYLTDKRAESEWGIVAASQNMRDINYRCVVFHFFPIDVLY